LSELRLPLPASVGPRTFVLDTNVLLYDPGAIYHFHEHAVVIPITVIEEIDKFKKDANETGRNARTVSRYLDGMRRKGSLGEGVPTNEKGGSIRVDFFGRESEVAITWGADNNDNRILACARRLQIQLGENVALITRDTNMRLKCDALGINAEDYEHSQLEVDEVYTGMADREVSADLIDSLYQHGHAEGDGLKGLCANQFVMLTAEDTPGKSAMARWDGRRNRLRLVGRHKEGVWGIFARNKEQLFAMDLLLDESVQLVSLNGVAGTGKTLVALACGLQQVADQQTYRKLLVSRPIFPLGRDMGFLPGDVEQKLNPWMKPIFDNLEFLLSTRSESSSTNRREVPEPEYQYLMDQKIIEVEPLTYIRGRSIPRQYLIVDEAQNLTPHEVKTVLTRAGEGTKVILTGDPYQIDNPYVDALSNGLTYTVERFKNSTISGHVTLRKGERSELAELAAQLL
jgi:PhoH-like ATPase